MCSGRHKSSQDVTIILKSIPGAKRLQPTLLRNVDAPPPAHAQQPSHAAAHNVHTTVEPNYTIILGSHRNSCLKFEKNGVTKAMVWFRDA